MNHLVPHVKNQHLRSDNTLHVIGVVSNYVRWNSRYRLFRQWAEEMVQTPNVKLHVVELVYGDRSYECNPETATEYEKTQTLGYNYLAVHTKSEVWAKENQINLAVKHLLPRDWKYVAWVDCDVHFRNHNWARETIHQLQHYPIVQPFSDAVDLSFDGGVLNHFKSIGYYSAKNIPHAPSAKNPYHLPYGHVGFAYACTRLFYENVEKLLDFAILGAADNHMAWACLGDVIHTMNPQISDGYKKACLAFQEKANYACGGIIGYTPGRLEHNFHGSKSKRGYWTRWQILIKNHYDPLKDLRYNQEGVIQLKGKHGLEKDIMHYNRSRREDSLEND